MHNKGLNKTIALLRTIVLVVVVIIPALHGGGH